MYWLLWVCWGKSVQWEGNCITIDVHSFRVDFDHLHHLANAAVVWDTLGKRNERWDAIRIVCFDISLHRSIKYRQKSVLMKFSPFGSHPAFLYNIKKAEYSSFFELWTNDYVSDLEYFQLPFFFLEIKELHY